MGVRSFLKSKLQQAGLPIPGARPAPGGKAPPPATSTKSPAAPIATEIEAGLKSLPKEPDAEGYVAVTPSRLIPEGGRNTFKVGDEPVAVFRVEGKVYVIGDECLHENGPLGEGNLKGHVVSCAYHDWRYDIRDGSCLTNPGMCVPSYQVKEKDGFVWVGKKLREGSKERGGEHDDGLKVRNIHER